MPGRRGTTLGWRGVKLPLRDNETGSYLRSILPEYWAKKYMKIGRFDPLKKQEDEDREN
jgi:hypothetical protein